MPALRSLPAINIGDSVMIEVQLTARDAKGGALFYTLGLGVNFVAAKAAAKVGYRARIAADAKLAGKVAAIEAEAI